MSEGGDARECIGNSIFSYWVINNAELKLGVLDAPTTYFIIFHFEFTSVVKHEVNTLLISYDSKVSAK